MFAGRHRRGKFYVIYGTQGTQALFTGLATQILYGDCGHDTADFYSKASGTTTADPDPEPGQGQLPVAPDSTLNLMTKLSQSF